MIIDMKVTIHRHLVNVFKEMRSKKINRGNKKYEGKEALFDCYSTPV